MKQLLTTILLLTLCHFLKAQKEKVPFSLGVQSGVNFTYNTLPENDYVQGDVFLGNSFGMVARHYLNHFKYSWGGFNNRINLYLDYGLHYHYRGYNYSIQRESFLQEKIQLSLPVLLVFRSDNKYAPRSWRKKRRYTIGKVGLQFDQNFKFAIEQTVELPAIQVVEFFDMEKLTAYFIGEVGIQQYAKKNNSFMYIGLSFHNALGKTIKGSFSILDRNTAVIQQFDFTRLGSYFSLNCQYFFDLQKREKISKQTIYSPRYL